MVNELLKTIKAGLYDRVTSPLAGSMAISFVLSNYKFFLIILSQESIRQKFLLIDAYWSCETIITKGVFFPALGVVFFLGINPWLSSRIYRWVRSRQLELKKIQVELDTKTPLSEEEASELRDLLSKREVEHQKNILGLAEDIKKLEKIVSEKNSQIDLLRNELKEFRDKIVSRASLNLPEIHELDAIKRVVARLQMRRADFSGNTIQQLQIDSLVSQLMADSSSAEVAEEMTHDELLLWREKIRDGFQRASGFGVMTG